MLWTRIFVWLGVMGVFSWSSMTTVWANPAPIRPGWKLATLYMGADPKPYLFNRPTRRWADLLNSRGWDVRLFSERETENRQTSLRDVALSFKDALTLKSAASEVISDFPALDLIQFLKSILQAKDALLPEELLILINTHGKHSELSASVRRSWGHEFQSIDPKQVRALKQVVQALDQKGVRILILDQSCYSGATVASEFSDHACVVSDQNHRAVGWGGDDDVEFDMLEKWSQRSPLTGISLYQAKQEKSKRMLLDPDFISNFENYLNRVGEFGLFPQVSGFQTETAQHLENLFFSPLFSKRLADNFYYDQTRVQRLDSALAHILDWGSRHQPDLVRSVGFDLPASTVHKRMELIREGSALISRFQPILAAVKQRRDQNKRIDTTPSEVKQNKHLKALFDLGLVYYFPIIGFYDPTDNNPENSGIHAGDLLFPFLSPSQKDYFYRHLGMKLQDIRELAANDTCYTYESQVKRSPTPEAKRDLSECLRYRKPEIHEQLWKSWQPYFEAHYRQYLGEYFPEVESAAQSYREFLTRLQDFEGEGKHQYYVEAGALGALINAYNSEKVKIAVKRAEVLKNSNPRLDRCRRFQL